MVAGGARGGEMRADNQWAVFKFQEGQLGIAGDTLSPLDRKPDPFK